MKNIIISLLILVELSSNCFAYPITPRPLRALVAESEFIILGYVVKTFENKNENNPWTSKIAKITVLENLQGKMDKDTIALIFCPNMICPAPDEYYDSTYVISFLKKDKNGKFYTHALSYGAKTLKKKDIEIYKQRILEIQQILKITDSEEQKRETVEWLVKCAEHEITSWEGTFELNSIIDYKKYDSCDTCDFKQDFNKRLNSEQKERLKLALLNFKQEVDFHLVNLVYEGNEKQVDVFLLNKLRILKEVDFWNADSFMDRLLYTTKN
jgi:hypothetical protein